MRDLLRGLHAPTAECGGDIHHEQVDRGLVLAEEDHLRAIRREHAAPRFAVGGEIDDAGRGHLHDDEVVPPVGPERRQDPLAVR